MYQIKIINNIPEVGLQKLGDSGYRYDEGMKSPDAIMMRSEEINQEMFPPSLLAIARVGVGVNNIPISRCAQQGIVVFNTPGANANAVKEMTVLGLLLASRKIVQAAKWVDTIGNEQKIESICEAHKKEFVGPELMGKTLGVVGMGSIGSEVANAAEHLGMKVYGYDPYISLDHAWNLSQTVTPMRSLEDLLAHCDYVTLHAPATEETRHIINASNIKHMKQGARLLNFARMDLVDTHAVKQAVESGKLACFVTDFCTTELIGVPNIISLPHLGGSTPESEENCAVMAAAQLMDYLENGNITHSINFPSATLARSGEQRLCIIHKNIKQMLFQISSVVAEMGYDIVNMVNKSRGDYAYTIMDVDGNTVPLQSEVDAIEGVIRTRVL